MPLKLDPIKVIHSTLNTGTSCLSTHVQVFALIHAAQLFTEIIHSLKVTCNHPVMFNDPNAISRLTFK